jgi:hypothetical protein
MKMKCMTGVGRAGVFWAVLSAAAAAPAAETVAPVRAIEAGELTLAGYTVIARLWTGTWRPAFWIPMHEDSGAAIATLGAEAGRLGADAMTNLYCLQDDRGLRAGYYCYALAIKLK